MAIKYKSLGHVALYCKDYDKMYDFYVNQLGCKDVFHLNHEDGSLFLTYLLAGKDQFIELFPQSYERANTFGERSHTHFCLELATFPLELEAIEAQGITIYNGPEDPQVLPKPYGAIPQGMCGSKCAFIKDPEGNWIELMQFTPDSMQILCNRFTSEV